MAQINDSHEVEIRIDPETNQQNPPISTEPSPISHHPLTEISESPGHLLLLKLFQREEEHISHKMGLKEARLHSLKREAFYLSSLFFFFHGLCFTILFTSSVSQGSERKACKNWWVPILLSLMTSIVLILSIQMKVYGYWKAMADLKRERSDGRAMKRCITELRMKGASFDLSRDIGAYLGGKKMKSSSVEIAWKPLRWLKMNLVAFFFLLFTGLVLPASKFVLCS